MRVNKDGTMDIFAGEKIGVEEKPSYEQNPLLKTNRFTKEWFAQDKQFTLLDVGCYDGHDSAEYIHDLGLDRSRIFSFEADPRIAKYYRENHTKLIEQGKMNLIEGAVSNIDGELTWYASDVAEGADDKGNRAAPSGTHKYPRGHMAHHKHIEFTEIKVQSMKLDTWFEQQDFDLIDFIHVDVNGGEKEFIEGACDTLNNHTKFLWMEFMTKTGHWDNAEPGVEMLTNFDHYDSMGFNQLWINRTL